MSFWGKIFGGGTQSSLLEAVEQNDIASVKVLLEKGADVNAKANNGVTALMSASFKGYNGIVKALLAKGADVNTKDNNGVTALITAALLGYSDCVNALLAKGADVNAKANNDVTALMSASFKGYNGIVKALLAKGADVNTKDNEGVTALINASQEGHGDVVNALLANGADASAKNNNGATALDAANAGDHKEIIQLLKGAVGVVKLPEENGTASQKKEYKGSLITAVEDGDISKVSFFLAQGVAINTPTGAYTALYLASRKGYSNIVKLLLDHKADVNIKNGDSGYTALDIASLKGYAEVVQLLLDHGADKTGNTGFTENCPSLRGGSPKEIIEYWELLSTSQKACGNCRHLSYGVGEVDPLCYMEQTIAIINKLDHSNIKPKEVKPTDYCMSWFKRG